MTIIIHEENEVPVCYTCKREIEFLPCRIVNLEDNDYNFNSVYFHYFFPCWDPDYFIQTFGKCVIVSSGFICDEQILEKPLIVKNLEKNMDLWY